MNLRIALLSFALLAALCSGCATYDQHPAGHHIAVDEDGKPLGHIDDTFKVKVLSQDELSTRYINPIIDGIKEHVKRHKNSRNPAKILLFIHGGLNGYTNGIDHVKNLLAAQKTESEYPNLEEYYLISLNWEAGLRSALLDHFFGVRAGKRAPIIAPLTFPFVFVGDVGQSVLNLPRDMFYAYGQDLFATQLPQLGTAGLTAGGVAAFYGGIIAGTTNLLFKDIIFQSLIVAGGIYGSPVFFADPLYYSFGPIRMLSAPFVDGFGTPAWQMLKRRTDFVLHNPEIFSDTSEKGAGYSLLKQLAEKIETDGLRNWITQDGEQIPIELTLAGHSMGAMVVDRILLTFSDKLVFNNIIYMGAANSLADFQLYVIPYLRKHSESRLWSFSLADLDETNEHYALDLIMRGSLLVWIEKFFEPQYSILQRRFGRELSQDYVNIDDELIWRRTCRITSSRDLIRGEPEEHGDFTKPKVLEQALSIVNHRGCPLPVDINNRAKEELKEELAHIPESFNKPVIDMLYTGGPMNSRVDDDLIDNIIAQRPYAEKEDLVDRQIVSDFMYDCIRDFITPVNINSATIGQLARLLRGDRLLANKILTRRDKTGLYKSIEELHKEKIVPDFVYNQIENKIVAIKDPLHRECRAEKDLSQRLYLPLIIPQYFPPLRFFIYKDWERYKDEIVWEIRRSGIARVVSISERKENSRTMEDFWGAVLEVGGQRVGLDIHTSAQLGGEGSLGEWWTKPLARDEHSKDIATRAKTDGLSTVFLVWNKDVFKWPRMAEMINSLELELDRTKLVVIHGSPKKVVAVILATIKKEERDEQPASSIPPTH